MPSSPIYDPLAAGQGPVRDSKNPKDNKFGHQYMGKSRDGGYGVCEWCDCRENTKPSAEQCPNAVKWTEESSGKVIWIWSLPV